MKCSLSFSGFDELDDDFKLLSQIEQRQVSKKAVRAAAVVFRDEVKKVAPVAEGILKRSVSVDTIRGQAAIAGVKFKKVKTKKSQKGKAVLSPFYWQFLENGTSKMAAKPFVRPAFDANVNKAEKVAFNQYEQDIERIFAK